jgi:type II secretory pathway predicted ATPase ExeA/transposase-like protein
VYLEHFRLKEPPFRITPHTDFFFQGADRGATLDALQYAILNDEGIVKVTGEIGSGKTMLCRVLIERLPAEVETVFLANPSFSRGEILQAIAAELGVQSAAAGAPPLRELQAHLIQVYAGGRRVVVLIDEAHAMPEETLEQVRLLSNLEAHRHKLLQLVLFGQPELDTALDKPSLRQLKDRITHSFRMRPLTPDEVSKYISFRLHAAGCSGPEIFGSEALAAIAEASGGLTRRINVLSDKALLAAFMNDSRTVALAHAQAAIADSEFAPIHRAPGAETASAVSALGKARCAMLYDDRLRVAAVRLSRMPGVRVKDVAAALEIRPRTLSLWRKQVRAGRLAAGSTKIDLLASADALRLRHLERRYRQISEELGALKRLVGGTPTRRKAKPRG